MRTLATLALLLTMSSNPRTPSGQPGPMQPSDYTPAGPSQVVSWQLKRLPPPSALYVTVNDKLVVGAATSQTNEVITVNYRLLRAADGVVVPGQFTIKPVNTRAITVQQQQLAEGFLLSASVKAAVSTTRGQTFTRVFLGAGPFGAGQPSYMLMADYVTTAMAPAHPNGRVLAPSEGPGWYHGFSNAAPITGNDWIVNVPANARWRVVGVLAQLTTAVAVANRTVIIEASSGASFFFESSGNVVQAASIIALYSAGPTVPNGGAVTTVVNMALPENMRLTGNDGGLFGSRTVNIQAADAWSAQGVFVEEWLDNV